LTREKGRGPSVFEPWVIVLVVIAALAVAFFVARRVRQARALWRRGEAMATFPADRTALEAEFLTAASATGKPRGLRWTGCRLEGEPLFAQDRGNGELYALVPATISFAAIEGGGMEEVEAVSNLRAGTATFVHRGGRWTTDGRAVFNLDPAGTVEHYQETLAKLDV
jgi:hypothetical protein